MKPYWQTIFDSMNRVDEWHVNAHYLTHKSGVQFWIANGRPHFRLESAKMPMGFFMRRKLWRKACELIPRIIANDLQPVPQVDSGHRAGEWMN